MPTRSGTRALTRATPTTICGSSSRRSAAIVIYGWSLGSAVAVNLASHVDEAAVVLEGAPASIVAIGQQRYPFFPIRLLIRNPFESITAHRAESARRCCSCTAPKTRSSRSRKAAAFSTRRRSQSSSSRSPAATFTRAKRTRSSSPRSDRSCTPTGCCHDAVRSAPPAAGRRVDARRDAGRHAARARRGRRCTKRSSACAGSRRRRGSVTSTPSARSKDRCGRCRWRWRSRWRAPSRTSSRSPTSPSSTTASGGGATTSATVGAPPQPGSFADTFARLLAGGVGARRAPCTRRSPRCGSRSC